MHATPRDISWTKPSTYAIRASGNHQKETMDVLFTHKWTHGPTRRDVQTNGIQILVQFKQFGLFKQKHTPSQLVCVSNIC